MNWKLKPTWLSNILRDIKNNTLISTVLILNYLVLFIIIPPFQSPDEFAHFSRAYQISYGSLYPEVAEGFDTTTIDIPEIFIELESITSNLRFSPNEVFDYKEFYNQGKDNIDTSQSEYIYSSADTYTFTNYILSAFALFVSREIGLAAITAYYMARFLNILFGLFAIYLSIKVYPSFKYLFLTIGIMPMYAFQISSTAADSIVFSLSMIYSAICFHYFKRDSNFNYKSGILLFLFTLLLLYTKNILIALTLLSLLPISNIKSISKKFLYSILILILPNILAVLAFYAARVHYIDVLSNPIEFETQPFNALHLIIAIVKDFNSLSDFYLISFIGQLGWLDTKLNFILIILPCSITLIASAMLSLRSFKQISLLPLFLSLVLILHALLLYLTLYLFWYRLGFNSFGIQGRYFIPISIPMLLLIGSIFNKFVKLKSKAFVWYYPYIIATISCLTLLSVFQRYYLNT